MINELNANKLQSGNESIVKAIKQVGSNKKLLLKFGEETARRAIRRARGESGCQYWNAYACAWIKEEEHLATPAEIKNSFQRMCVRTIAHCAGDTAFSYAEMIYGADCVECAISISLRSIDAAREIKWWDNENSDAEAMLLEQEEQLECLEQLIGTEKDNTKISAIDKQTESEKRAAEENQQENEMSQGAEILVDRNERASDAPPAKTLKVGNWIKLSVHLNDDGEDGYGNFTAPFLMPFKILSVKTERRYGNKNEYVYLELQGKIRPYSRNDKHEFAIDLDMPYRRYKQEKVKGENEWILSELTSI